MTERAPRVGALRWHLLALVGILLALWPLLDLDGAFISDEGSYAVQERALAAGSWNMGYPFEAADPDRRFVAFDGATLTSDAVVPYSAQPLWPVLLRGATGVLGVGIGLRALGVVAAAGLAAVAWALASDLGGRRAGPWGFWVAAASPVLANAWITWAHAPSACAGALVLLAARRSERSVRWLGLALVAAALSVLLRAEGLLWVGAVAAALLVVERRAAVGRAAAIALSGAAALAATYLWRAAIVDGETSTGLHAREAGASLLDRLGGFRRALLDGGFAATDAKAAGLAVLVLVAGAVVLVRRRAARDRAVAAALALAATVLAARIAIAPRDPVPGLLVAAPTLMLAALRPPADARHRMLWTAVLLFGIAVAATIYPDGGSLQWGGRFLSPATGGLAALAGAAVAGCIGPAARRTGDRNLLAVAAAALLAVQAAGAIVVPEHVRAISEDPMDRLIALGPDVFVAGGRQIARLDWQGWPERCWIAVPDDERAADARAVVEVLRASGVGRAAYAGLDPALLRAAGAAVEPAGGDLQIGTLTIADVTSPLTIEEPYRCHG